MKIVYEFLIHLLACTWKYWFTSYLPAALELKMRVKKGLVRQYE